VHRVFIFLVILVAQEQLPVAQAEVVAMRWANEDLAQVAEATCLWNESKDWACSAA
jgi:hypothetical protein